jgi:hypothetical protein
MMTVKGIFSRTTVNNDFFLQQAGDFLQYWQS